MPKEMLVVEMTRRSNAPWGIRIGGGQDRGRVLVLENIAYNSIAAEAGLRTRDYIVEVNGQGVFGMNHNACKDLIKRAGDRLTLKVERGDHIVPSMDEAFPKKGQENRGSGPTTNIIDSFDGPHRDKPYWMRSIEEGHGLKGSNGFTTVGKPKMVTKQYNSPLEMYSDEALDEIMKEGTLNGKPFDVSNLMNPTGAEFNERDSAVLNMILANANKRQQQQPAGRSN